MALHYLRRECDERGEAMAADLAIEWARPQVQKRYSASRAPHASVGQKAAALVWVQQNGLRSYRDVAGEFRVSLSLAKVWMAEWRKNGSLPKRRTTSNYITDQEAAFVRRMLADGASTSEVATTFRVPVRVIRDIRRGHSFKGIPAAPPEAQIPAPAPRLPASRYRRGQRALTRDDVAQIKLRLSRGETCAALAKEFVVGAEMIGRIKRGKSWADVPPASEETP